MREVNGNFLAEFRAARFEASGSTVLGPLDLAIKPGEFWGVAGPNGAGKTTLLMALMGQRQPAGGSVRLRWWEDWGRLGAGILLQHHHVHPNLPLSVEETVGLGFAGRPGRPEDRKKLEWAMETAGVVRLKDRPYRDLSGGERRKTQIARLLAQGAPLLLLDEPFAGLDPDWQERLARLVETLWRRHHRTVVMVTHAAEALPLRPSKMLLLKSGRVLASGGSKSVLTGTNLSKLYGCPMGLAVRAGRPHAFSLGQGDGS